ncbi:MAG: hypothetical protein JOZ55_11630 [Alphaproteobacteria bacterium]|nr:hypothetical protein [Alphaproteobacteria bacterium]
MRDPIPNPWLELRPSRARVPGIAASLLLHASALLIGFLLILRAANHAQSGPHIVPVDIVLRLGEAASTPDKPTATRLPPRAAQITPQAHSSNPRPREGVAPTARKPLPLDNFDAKLRALARLRLPPATLPGLDNAGTEELSGTAVQGEASYSLNDFVRAQVERRWNLDFSTLGDRHFVIPLRVVMRSDGRIERAEIVERNRSISDPVYRAISLSARNAVLLSSPIALPPGQYDDVMRMTIVFNPADMRR